MSANLSLLYPPLQSMWLRRLEVLEGFLWIDSPNGNDEASNSLTEVLETIKFLGTLLWMWVTLLDIFIHFPPVRNVWPCRDDASAAFSFLALACEAGHEEVFWWSLPSVRDFVPSFFGSLSQQSCIFEAWWIKGQAPLKCELSSTSLIMWVFPFLYRSIGVCMLENM